MIESIRYQQFMRQSKAISPLLSAQSIATYQGRDPLTGQRLVRLADGSIDRGNYLSDSEPAATPQYQPGRSIGVPGYLNNR
jgi:hypothetical protein